MGKLTPLGVKNAKPGRHADGDGLYLLVKPSGSKSWLLRVQTDGRRRDFGLGPLAKLSLSAARDKAKALREKVFAGFDPVLAQKARRAIPTFEMASRECHRELGSKWVAQHRVQWLESLEDHVFGAIGSVSVDLLNAALIADAIRKSWGEVPNTARRVLQRIGLVIDYSRAMGWRTADSPMRSVRLLLPDHRLETKHFPAEPHESLPEFVGKLADPRGNIGSLATAFCILTASRPNEVRFMSWGDVDMNARSWTIPANKMKGRKAHCIPLSSAALSILKHMAGLFRGGPQDRVFPGRGIKPMSNMTMSRAFRVAGSKATVHGSARSTFTDWAEEKTDFKSGVIQASLAHKTPDATEAAYKRTTFYDLRSALMEQWGQHLVPPEPAGNVVPLARAGR